MTEPLSPTSVSAMMQGIVAPPSATMVSPGHVSLQDLNAGRRWDDDGCALCGSRDAVLPEDIPKAADVDDDVEDLSLPLCGVCSQRQRRARSKHSLLSLAVTFISLVTTTTLGLATPLTLTSMLVVLVLTHVVVTVVFLPWLRRRREQAVPLLVVGPWMLQVPFLGKTNDVPAPLQRRHRQGLFVFGSLLSLPLTALLWDASNPPLVVDNPMQVTCTYAVDGVETSLPPTKTPIEKGRLRFGQRTIDIRCPNVEKQLTTRVRWGQVWVLSTRTDGCYKSSKQIVQDRDLPPPVTYYDPELYGHMTPVLSTSVERDACSDDATEPP